VRRHRLGLRMADPPRSRAPPRVSELWRAKAGHQPKGGDDAATLASGPARAGAGRVPAGGCVPSFSRAARPCAVTRS
jgi:hypothetical protein